MNGDFGAVVDGLSESVLAGSSWGESFLPVTVGMEESTESSEGLVINERTDRLGKVYEVSDSSDGDVATYLICRRGNLPGLKVSDSSDGLVFKDEEEALMLALFGLSVPAVGLVPLLLRNERNAAGGDRTLGDAKDILGLDFVGDDGVLRSGLFILSLLFAFDDFKDSLALLLSVLLLLLVGLLIAAK